MYKPVLFLSKHRNAQSVEREIFSCEANCLIGQVHSEKEGIIWHLSIHIVWLQKFLAISIDFYLESGICWCRTSVGFFCRIPVFHLQQQLGGVTLSVCEIACVPLLNLSFTLKVRQQTNSSGEALAFCFLLTQLPQSQHCYSFFYRVSLWFYFLLFFWWAHTDKVCCLIIM